MDRKKLNQRQKLQTKAKNNNNNNQNVVLNGNDRDIEISSPNQKRRIEVTDLPASQLGTRTMMGNAEALQHKTTTDPRSRPEGGDSGKNKAHSREHDQFLPVANVVRIMRKALPPHAKVSDEAKERVQECVSEFISFLTSEANATCQQEHRKTVTAEDLIGAMSRLGFEHYVGPLMLYLQKYRENEMMPMMTWPGGPHGCNIGPNIAPGGFMFPPQYPIFGAAGNGVYYPSNGIGNISQESAAAAAAATATATATATANAANANANAIAAVAAAAAAAGNGVYYPSNEFGNIGQESAAAAATATAIANANAAVTAGAAGAVAGDVPGSGQGDGGPGPSGSFQAETGFYDPYGKFE